MILVIEGIVGCFILLISCVVGIAQGPVNLVSLYEKEVQERVVELGLITKEKIRKNATLFVIFGMIPFFAFILCFRHHQVLSLSCKIIVIGS